MKKRIISLILALVFSLGLCAGTWAVEAPYWDEGTLGDGAFSWRVTRGGSLIVIPSLHTQWNNDRVYAACYDRVGRFLGAKVFSDGQTAATLDPRTVRMKFMLTDGTLTPQCEAVTAAQGEALDFLLDHYVTQTTEASFPFTGFVTPAAGASMTVNGRAAEMNAYGAYGITLPLALGCNVFTLAAANTAGEAVSMDVCIWRTEFGDLSQEYVFLTGNTWTAALGAYWLPVVDARGVATAIPVTEALKNAVAADSMKLDRLGGNTYVGRFCSITELNDDGVVAALTPVETADVRSLGNDVITTAGSAAWDYDDATRCVFVDLFQGDDGRVCVAEHGSFSPDSFPAMGAVAQTPGSDAPFRAIQAAVIAPEYSTTADFIYLVRTLNGGPLPPSIDLRTSTLTLNTGDSIGPLGVSVYPPRIAEDALVWSSSDPTVVTVTGGAVHAVGEGTAVITVSTADGTLSDSCTCTVKAVPPVCMVVKTEFDSASGGLWAKLLFLDGSTQTVPITGVNGRAVVVGSTVGSATVPAQYAQSEIAGQQDGDVLTKFFTGHLTPDGCELVELNAAGGTSPDWEDPITRGDGTSAVASIWKESFFAKQLDATVSSQTLRDWPVTADALTFFIVSRIDRGTDEVIYNVYRGFRSVPEMDVSRLTAICANTTANPADVNTVAAYVYLEAAS